MKANVFDKGDFLRYENKIFQIIEIKHTHLGRGSANLTFVLKNIQTGQRIEKVFKPDEELDYLEIEKKKIVFIDQDEKNLIFQEDSKKHTLSKNLFEVLNKYLKKNLEVIGYFDNERNLITIELPKIIEYKVISAPPGFKGDTVQGSYKNVVIETGYEVKAPFFIKEGDIIRINTETGEYVERVQ